MKIQPPDQVLILQPRQDLVQEMKKGLRLINSLDFPEIPILIKPNICTRARWNLRFTSGK